MCTLSSTQDSRKTDTKFQPLDASPSNKLCDLPICLGKVHKETGHQKRHTRKVTSIYTWCVHLLPLPIQPDPQKTQHTHPAALQMHSKQLARPFFFFFFWWGLLHGPQQGPDRMKEKKPIRLGKGKLLPKQKNPP